MTLLHEDDATMGQRLRALRLWRGMSLAEVAGLAGLSAPYLSMAERGLRIIDRRSTIAALAAALRVSETDLAGGPHLGADPGQSAPHSAIPALRVALETNRLGEYACGTARPVAELTQVLEDQVKPLYFGCDYVQLGQHLPPVIDELHCRIAQAGSGEERRQALLALVEACAFAAFRAKDLGYHDLAHLAAARASEAAALTGDPVAAGKASYVWLQTMPRSWERTKAAAERAAAAVAKDIRGDDTAGLQVLGQISLTAALASAVCQDGQAAADWLDQADRLADQIPDQPARGWHCFSRTNIATWRVAIAVERGESGKKLLTLAGAVDETKLDRCRSRLASVRCEAGRGLARDPRTRDEAIRWLRGAEAAAPQRIRNSAAARETVTYLLTRARAEAGGRELRGMAARMGIAH